MVSGGRFEPVPSSYLDTKALEAFIAVMSIGSMTGAARALGRSQSVVTRAIQDLEVDLGFPLLHRNGPKIAPTAQGVEFFEQAEMLLSGLRTISERARKIGEATARPIEIASIPSLAASIVPLALAALPAPLPSHIHLQTTASENVVQAVVARTADLGLASLPLDNPGAEVHWLAEVPCVAAVADTHPLAFHDQITAADLAGQRIIVSANPYRLRLSINEALAAQGVSPGEIIDSNATFVSLALARQGLGIAVVEALTCFGLPVAGVRILPLTIPISFRWGVITALGRPLSPITRVLVEELKLATARIVPAHISRTLSPEFM